MLKAASYGTATLLAAQLAAGLLSARVAFLRPVQPLATLAAEHLGSVLAAYVAARHARRWSWLLGLLMSVPATALWTALGAGDVLNGVVFYTTEDLVAGTAEALLRRLGREPTSDLMTRAAAAYSLVVNLVLCAAGATWGHARAIAMGRAGATPGGAHARRLGRAGLWITTLAAALVFVVSARALALQAIPPKANLWILPDRCVGWVEVDFNVPGAAPLPQEDGYGVIRVPVTGHVQTSSAFVESGRFRAWYERDGNRIAVPETWAYWTCPSSLGRSLAPSEPVSLFVFFGPKADYDRMHAMLAKPPNPHKHAPPGLVGCVPE